MEDRGVRHEEGAESPPGHAGDAMPDVRADVFDALMTRLEAFGDEFARLARTKEQKVLAEAFGELVGDVHASITYIAEATRRYGPPKTGPVATASSASPADLAEGAAPAAQQPDQRQTRGRSIGI